MGLLAGVPATVEPSEPLVRGRSPARLAWARLRRDRTTLISGAVVMWFGLVALAAPLIAAAYGGTPDTAYTELLSDENGLPYGYFGGISGDHWLGIEPQLGRDLLLQLVYGARTSLGIAAAGAVLSTAIGVVIGVVSGYFGGVVGGVLNWFTDFMLAFPFFLFCLAAIPVLNLALADENGQVSDTERIMTIVAVFAAFGWMSTARLVRGQVLSLREREFVEAARAAGAGPVHILFGQLLPNLWGPIIVTVSLTVPQLVTAEAGLSFLNIGVAEPTPDWGRTIHASLGYLQTDPAFTFFPGVSIFVLVLAFNLLGDALRDALDPRSLR